MTRLTRRFILTGMLGGLVGRALAEAPMVSPRPPARPLRVGAVSAPSAAELIRAAGLGGRVGFVVADARTGLVLESSDGDLPMPPASTAKIVTSLYALDRLGPGHRFGTRLIATGPVAGRQGAGRSGAGRAAVIRC